MLVLRLLVLEGEARNADGVRIESQQLTERHFNNYPNGNSITTRTLAFYIMIWYNTRHEYL